MYRPLIAAVVMFVVSACSHRPKECGELYGDMVFLGPGGFIVGVPIAMGCLAVADWDGSRWASDINPPEVHPYKVHPELRAKAEGGDADSQFNLGLQLSIDRRDEAYDWMCRAAAQNHDHAQYTLGWWHQAAGTAQGEWHRAGISPDPRIAYAWFTLAARNGNSTAPAWLDRLTPNLSADQLKEAQTMAYKWTPAQGCQMGASMSAAMTTSTARPRPTPDAAAVTTPTESVSALSAARVNRRLEVRSPDTCTVVGQPASEADYQAVRQELEQCWHARIAVAQGFCDKNLAIVGQPCNAAQEARKYREESLAAFDAGWKQRAIL